MCANDAPRRPRGDGQALHRSEPECWVNISQNANCPHLVTGSSFNTFIDSSQLCNEVIYSRSRYCGSTVGINRVHRPLITDQNLATQGRVDSSTACSCGWLSSLGYQQLLFFPHPMCDCKKKFTLQEDDAPTLPSYNQIAARMRLLAIVQAHQGPADLLLLPAHPGTIQRSLGSQLEELKMVTSRT